MKIYSIIALIVALGATYTQAAAPTKVALYSFSVVDHSTDVYGAGMDITTNISVDEKGLLFLEVLASHTELGTPLKKTTKRTTTLSPTLSETIKSQLEELSDVKIKTKINKHLCLHIPPSENIDIMFAVLNSSGVLVETLGPQGCWVKKSIRPVDEFYFNDAKNVTGQLKAISLMLLNK